MADDQLTSFAADYRATIRDLTPYITNQRQVTGASSLALVLVDSNQVVWATGFGLAYLIIKWLGNTEIQNY